MSKDGNEETTINQVMGRESRIEIAEKDSGPLKDAWKVEFDAIEIWKRHGCAGRTASATLKETAEGSFIRSHFHDSEEIDVDYHVDYSQDAEGNVTIGYDTPAGANFDALRIPAGSRIDEGDALALLSEIKGKMKSLGYDVLPKFNPGEAVATA